MIKQFLRVKHIADQKFQRNEKSSVLTDELSAAEKRVDLIKESCCAAGKKLSACVQRLAPDVASDRRNNKKMPEAALAQCMEEWGLSLGESSILGLTLVDYARIQDALASDLLLYKLQVDENIVEPLQNILTTDVSKILKFRKQLFKLTSEMDAAKSRYQSAQRSSHLVSGNGSVSAAAKAQLLKEETEDIVSRVDQCRDSLTAEMFNLISREPEMSQLFVKLCQLQLEHHRKAFYMLESALPEIEAQIKSCPHQPVFGVPLEDHLQVTNREIAIVIESSVCWLLESAMEEEGLFRIGGSMIKIKKMKSAFDASFQHLLDDERDPHNVAGVLKLYLRSLPEPLLTYKLYDQWMEAATEPDHNARLTALWNVVHVLPETHFRNLRYLIKFLSKLCQNSDVNKMSVQNIAIVIGPNLLWPPVEESVLGMNMTATNLHSSIVDTLITYSEWFFPGECEFYVSTPTSPRHLEGFPHPSLSESQLSLSAKFSNGDSAVESMSSSPTNSSPKSPSPRVPVRPRKKAAPRAPESSKNPITRSLSCGGFQAGVVARANAIHSANRHSTMSVSHENLLNANYRDAVYQQDYMQVQTIASECHEEQPPIMERPKPRSKPPRSHRNGLPPVAERRSRSIGRPSVPPPERPDSFSTSGSISTDISSVDSEKCLDPEDISLSFDSSGSESYNECQLSFMDDSDNDVSSSKSVLLEKKTINNGHYDEHDKISSDHYEEHGKISSEHYEEHCNISSGHYEEHDKISSNHYEGNGEVIFRNATKKSEEYSKMSNGHHHSNQDLESGKLGFKKLRENVAIMSETCPKVLGNEFQSSHLQRQGVEFKTDFKMPTQGGEVFFGRNASSVRDLADSINRNEYGSEENGAFDQTWKSEKNGAVQEDVDYSSDCHFLGGTPTWFDHYGEDKRQSNTLWFSDHGNKDVNDFGNYLDSGSVDEERDIFDCEKNFCTIIEVGTANKKSSNTPFKSTVSGTAIKLRVNSETHDTRL